jgi:hypothetical protein
MEMGMTKDKDAEIDALRAERNQLIEAVLGSEDSPGLYDVVTADDVKSALQAERGLRATYREEIDALKAEVETLKNHNEVQVGLAKLYQKQRNDERERSEKLAGAAEGTLELFRGGCGSDLCSHPDCGCFDSLNKALLAAKRDEGDGT